MQIACIEDGKSFAALRLPDGENLAWITTAGRFIQPALGIDSQTHPHVVLRLQCQAGLTSGEGKQLTVGDSATTVCSSAATEQNRRVASGSSRVKVHASLRQAAHDQCGIGCVVVDSSGDEIELLVCTAVAILQGDRDELFAEIAGCGVDEEALSRGGLDRHG